MPKANLNRSATDIAVSLLARREHTAAELGDKLRRRGIPEEEITAVLGRLTDTGVIDNERAALIIIRGELRKRPLGRMRLVSKLRQRRVPNEIITRCLSEFDETWEKEQCIRAVDRWIRTNSRSGQWREALTRHLRSRGFQWERIREALEFAGTRDVTDGEIRLDDDE